MPADLQLAAGPDGDADLARRVICGDEAALAALYDRFAGMVLAVAIRVTADRGAAEEVTQEVFAQAWRNAGKFDPERGTWRAWLATVAHRRAIDWVRSESASRRHAVQSVPEPVRSAEDHILDADLADRVRRAVAALPAQQRECVRMAYFEGRTVKELAAALGVPEGTAKTRLRAARLRLADLLGSEGAMMVP